MRHDLRLAFEESERRIAATKATELRIHPYLAVYAVRLSGDDSGHASAVLIERFEFHEATDALDLAENIARDPRVFASLDTGFWPDAIVVNDHDGNELAPPFQIGRLQVVKAAPPKRKVSLLWRMLGWGK